MTEYIFSHLPVPRAPDLERVDSELTTLVLGISIVLFKSTLYVQSFRGAHQCASMDLEADGADCGSTEADRLYTIA